MTHMHNAVISALINLGDARERSNQDDEAKACFQAALAIDPESQKALYNLGKLLAKQGEFDGAVYYLNEALRVNPKHYYAHLTLAGVLVTRDRDAAVRHLQAAYELLSPEARATSDIPQRLKELGASP